MKKYKTAVYISITTV